MAEVYKIRRRSDGKFSKGGSTPSFSSNGKIWKQRSHLTNHLSLLTEPGSNPTLYDDCEIVVYELTETEVSTTSVSEYIRERKEARERADAEWHAKYEEYRRNERLKLYEKLKDEFDS